MEDRASREGPPEGGGTEAFVAEWRSAAYNCFSSGHKFCREVCPVMQVTRDEAHTPTAFHANVVAMEQGVMDVEDVARDYVHCTQCGACELRCPNTLFTGDFYRFRTRTVDLVKADARPGRRRRGSTSRAGRSGTGSPTTAGTSRCWTARRSTRRGWPTGPQGLGLPVGRRDDPLLRLRGGLPPHLAAARGRPHPAGGRCRVRPHGRAVVLRGPGRRDGLRRPGAALRRAQRGRLAGDRREADHRDRPARLHLLHRGLPAASSATTSTSRSSSPSSWSPSWCATAACR